MRVLLTALLLGTTLLLPADTTGQTRIPVRRKVTQPTVVEKTVAPGRLLKLTAEGDYKKLEWDCGSLDVDLIQSESGKWAIFSCLIPDRYRVTCWAAKEDEPIRVVEYN